jgi:hypothetical protein
MKKYLTILLFILFTGCTLTIRIGGNKPVSAIHDTIIIERIIQEHNPFMPSQRDLGLNDGVNYTILPNFYHNSIGGVIDTTNLFKIHEK